MKALLQRLVGDEPAPGEQLLWLLVVPLLAAFGLRSFLPQRPDYLGHFLAGFGATLFVVQLAARASERRPGVILGATLACVTLGWALERTVFRLAAFDPIDFHSQSIGALLAGLAMLHASAERAFSSVVLLLAGLSLVLGFAFAFA